MAGLKELDSSDRKTSSLEVKEEFDDESTEEEDLELEISGLPLVIATGIRNDTNEEFEAKILKNVLEPLRHFDKRTLETKPMMAKARKRIVFGASETRKQLELGKIKAIIIARNLSDESLLEEDFRFCIEENEKVPKIYSLTRKQLGAALLNSSTRIGIVGLLKLDGVNETWNEITVEWEKLKASWSLKYEADCDCIWKCCYYGHVDILKKIYTATKGDQFKVIVNRGCFQTGRTPLFVSVQRDHYEIVKFLLEETCADEDIPDFSLNRPAHVVSSGRIAELLKFTSKPNAAGLTPIEVAIVNGHIDVIKTFLKQSEIPNVKLLFTATRSRTDKSIKFLLDKFKFDYGNLKAEQNEEGNSLLMESVNRDSYEVYKYLIAAGFEIDFSMTNVNNENILEIAQRTGNKGILRHLQSRQNKVSP